jgi:hypothetical protein
MDNVVKYSDIYERLINKLMRGMKLNRKESFIHERLCLWLAQDYSNKTYTYLEDLN